MNNKHKILTLPLILLTSLSLKAGEIPAAPATGETESDESISLLTVQGGWDSERYYRGFTLADDDFWWGGVEFMKWPFHLYANSGRSSGGYDETDLGGGLFFPLPKNFVFRIGYEWDHYGAGDFIVGENSVASAGLFYNSAIGRFALEDVYDFRFGGFLYRTGFLSKTIDITDKIGLNFETNLRFNDEFYGNPKSDFSNIEFIVNAPVRIHDHATITGFVRYNEALDDLGPFLQSGVTGGVTVAIRF